MSDLEEAVSILARVVSAANKGPLEGEDGFILGYQMAVGPIHAAIPFLQKQGITVGTNGDIHRAAVNLDDAISGAKVEAGLDPTEKYRPELWVDHLPEMWRRPFWNRQIELHESNSGSASQA